MTNITVLKKTKDRLDNIRKIGESYDQTIRRLLETAEKIELARGQKQILDEDSYHTGGRSG